MYNSGNMRDKKGIFTINEVSELDERSRSASGNAMVTSNHHVHPANLNYDDLLHKYELMESAHKKVSNECECYRKKSV